MVMSIYQIEGIVMSSKLWKPQVEAIIIKIKENLESWEELVELYAPESRAKKRQERLLAFKEREFDTTFGVSDELFSHGWYGLDQMMVNITSPGFKKKGVAVKKDKLEYLERLWTFSIKDADKKIVEDNQRRILRQKEEAEERAAHNFVVIFYVFLFGGLLLGLVKCTSVLETGSKNFEQEDRYMKKCMLNYADKARCERSWENIKEVDKYTR